MQPTTVIRGLSALVLIALAAGCGGGGSDVDKFLGTWMITQASASADCSVPLPGSQPLPITPSGNIEFAPGATSALAMVSPSDLDGFSVCDFLFDVSGPVATMQAGQKCTILGLSAPGFPAVLSPTTWTFSVTGPNSAEEVGSGTIELPTVDATQTPNGVVNCNYTAHKAMLTRIAKN